MMWGWGGGGGGGGAKSCFHSEMQRERVVVL